MHDPGHRFRAVLPAGLGVFTANEVLGHELVGRTADRLGCTAAQVVLAWTLSVAPNLLLIPGTSSVRHLEENLAVADIELDDDTRDQLTAIAA